MTGLTPNSVKHFFALAAGCFMSLAVHAQSKPFSINGFVIGREQKACPAGTFDETVEKGVTMCLINRRGTFGDVPLDQEQLFVLNGKIAAIGMRAKVVGAPTTDVWLKALTASFGPPTFAEVRPGEYRWLQGNFEMRLRANKGSVMIADIKAMVENDRKYAQQSKPQ